MPSSRLSLRLGQLPHNVLAELAAELCSDSPALQAAAEECMAANNPLPHETVERVQLSPDLVPHILGPLEAEDGAAAAVCLQWLAGWKATNGPRRRLKQVPLDFPEGFAQCAGLEMVATPDGRLVVGAGDEVYILDRSMHVLQSAAFRQRASLTAASDDSIFYVRNHPQALRRSTHNGTTAAEYRLQNHFFHCPVLAPGGLLFCVIFENKAGGEDLGRDQIIALDAQMLQLRHRFGLGLLENAQQLLVVGDELYACDFNNHRLQVFSLTGEHRRSIMGEWKSPAALCCVKDRLYLVEGDPSEEPSEPALPLQARRLLVLSLQGDILQVVTHPAEPTAVFLSICCFHNKLLARYYTKSAGSRTYGLLALQGG